MLTWENNPIQGAKDITEKLVVSSWKLCVLGDHSCGKS